MHLYLRTKKLGFRLPKIDRKLNLLFRIISLIIKHTKLTSGLITWKCGKPFIYTFRQLQSVVFFPTLNAINAKARPTSAFVLKHFVLAYFGTSSFIMDVVPAGINEPNMPADNLPDNLPVILPKSSFNLI